MVQFKRPSKAKAGLAAVAGIAVLLGGSSTFARWAEDASADAIDSKGYSIINGEWEVTGLELDILEVAWFDTHPAVVNAAGTYKAVTAPYCSNGSGTTEATCTGDWIFAGLGDGRGYGDTASTYLSSATVPSNLDGQEVDLEQVKFVPGDSLLGIFTFENDGEVNVSMLADHLRAKVDGVHQGTGESYVSPGNFQNITDEITAVAYGSGSDGYSWLGDNQIAVVVTYPYNDAEQVQISKNHYASDAGKTNKLETIGITGMTVTLVQVFETP